MKITSSLTALLLSMTLTPISLATTTNKLTSNDKADLDPLKPGYHLGRVFENLSIYLHSPPEKLSNAFDSAAKESNSADEKTLSGLAKDIIPCALSASFAADCKLTNTAKYHPYESLALQLNNSLGATSFQTGRLFYCAINELQGSISHEKYNECLEWVMNEKNPELKGAEPWRKKPNYMEERRCQ